MWCFVIGAAWAAPLTVDDVVRRALESSPAAIAAEAELDTLRGLRRSRSILLQNPTLEIEALQGSVSGEAIQPLSITGEGWAARSEARALTDAAEASRVRVRLELAAHARTAWAEAVIASSRAEAVRSCSTSLGAFAAPSRHARASVMLRRSTLHWRARRSRGRRPRARSAKGANRGADRGRDIPSGCDRSSGSEEDPGSAVPAPTTAAESRSDVAALAATVDARAADLRRQRAAAIPALGVGVVFDADGNVGPKGCSKCRSGNRSQAATGEARAALAEATAELEALGAVVSAEQRLGVEQGEDARALRMRLAGFDAQSSDALGFAAVAYERGSWCRGSRVLQSELLAGRLAALDAEALAIAMEIEALLAVEDPSLLGEVHHDDAVLRSWGRAPKEIGARSTTTRTKRTTNGPTTRSSTRESSSFVRTCFATSGSRRPGKGARGRRACGRSRGADRERRRLRGSGRVGPCARAEAHPGTRGHGDRGHGSHRARERGLAERARRWRSRVPARIEARRASERKIELAGGAVSAREVEDAAADSASADAELRAAESSLAAFGVGTGTEGGAVFALTSPIAGTVLSREARRGEVSLMRRTFSSESRTSPGSGSWCMRSSATPCARRREVPST